MVLTRKRARTSGPVLMLPTMRRSSAWNRGCRPPRCSWLSTGRARDRKSTRLNSSHANISYAVFCLKQKHLDHVYRNEAGIAANAARSGGGQNILDLRDCEIIPSDSPDISLVQFFFFISTVRHGFFLSPPTDGLSV